MNYANGNTAAPRSLEKRIGTVGSRLCDSLSRVLEALPGKPHRPNQVASLLNLNRDISGKVLSTVRASDPLAAAHVAPGPEPLRKFLRAARDHEVDPALIDEAEAAVAEFDLLIREVVGDRPALDAVISSMLPAARAKFELAAKQTAFKGISLLKGCFSDLWMHTALVHPASDDPMFNDVVFLYGTLGLRRIRPDMMVKFSYQQFGTAAHPWFTLDGKRPEESDGRELDQFCTLPPANLKATKTADGTIYALDGHGVGPASSTDKLLAEVRPKAMGRYSAGGARNLKSLFVAADIPVKQLVFDVLLCEGVYPGAEPMLRLFDTAVEGMASVNDPVRDADALDIRESITVLGRGRANFGHHDMTNYLPLLEHVCSKLNWDLNRFRGYRCSIQYPMHGQQVCMAFEAPPRPA